MGHTGRLVLRYAMCTDTGRQRQRNEDTGYASARLFAIADGMGGHAGGDVASSVAIGVLADLDRHAGKLRGAARFALLTGAVATISGRLAERVAADPDLTGMGTTLTAMLWDGTGFAVAHIGDSRGYLLRDGVLHQITADHTMVQALVTEGRMSVQEAATHPRRFMLMRAVQGGVDVEPDLFDCPARAGDRYLVCSDGLTDYQPIEPIAEVLRGVPEPDVAAARLVDLANAAGGADNVTCVVIDVRRGYRAWSRRARSEKVLR